MSAPTGNPGALSDEASKLLGLLRVIPGPFQSDEEGWRYVYPYPGVTQRAVARLAQVGAIEVKRSVSTVSESRRGPFGRTAGLGTRNRCEISIKARLTLDRWRERCRIYQQAEAGRAKTRKPAPAAGEGV